MTLLSLNCMLAVLSPVPRGRKRANTVHACPNAKVWPVHVSPPKRKLVASGPASATPLTVRLVLAMFVSVTITRPLSV